MRFLYRAKQGVLVFGDLYAYVFSLWLALFARNLAWPSMEKVGMLIPAFALCYVLWVVNNYINGLYDLELAAKRTYVKRYIETAGLSFLLGMAFFYIFPVKDIAPKTLLALSVALGYSVGMLWRIAALRLMSGKTLAVRLVFVGWTAETAELYSIFSHHPEKGYKVVAIIDPERRLKSSDLPDVHIYNSLQTIRPAISTHNADLAIVATHLRNDIGALRELYELLFWHVRLSDLPSFYESITGRIPPSTFSEGWFLDHLKNRELPVYNKIRNLLDVVAAFLCGTIFIMTLPFIALAIRLTSPGPVLIKQKRMGQYGVQFDLYKFRSMYALSPDGSAEINGVQFAVKNDSRVTPVGRFLRNSRLDELPQCINLLKRDISLIGPRPERPEIIKELERDMPYYPLRHIIKPGLTGWAAINQHYTDTMESSLKKLQYDLYYIKNRSLLLDISIILRTVNVVIRGMGQ
jgi:exopolysaccharide biosynthesis polyprenyl glycosylphosphotransferase